MDEMKRKKQIERQAWNAFSQTGEVGAYILYRAMKDKTGPEKTDL